MTALGPQMGSILALNEGRQRERCFGGRDHVLAGGDRQQRRPNGRKLHEFIVYAMHPADELVVLVEMLDVALVGPRAVPRPGGTVA